jgi:hypothetical protein
LRTNFTSETISQPKKRKCSESICIVDSPIRLNLSLMVQFFSLTINQFQSAYQPQKPSASWFGSCPSPLATISTGCSLLTGSSSSPRPPQGHKHVLTLLAAFCCILILICIYMYGWMLCVFFCDNNECYVVDPVIQMTQPTKAKTEGLFDIGPRGWPALPSCNPACLICLAQLPAWLRTCKMHSVSCIRGGTLLWFVSLEPSSLCNTSGVIVTK